MGLLLEAKGYKIMYEIQSGNEQESITVLITFSVDGGIVPPMIVYPYKRIPIHIANTIPQKWALGPSNLWWMVSSVFYEYIYNVF